MDQFEALKEQWSEIEDRDGIKLSWNVIPSTRMACINYTASRSPSHGSLGSFAARCTHRCPLHPAEREARQPSVAVRTGHLQATLQSCAQPLCVCFLTQPANILLTGESTVDTRARLWICPFCLSRNALPPHYKDITNDAIPPELHPQSTTIEYRLSRPAPSPPIFVYVVDTCQEDDSLKALKDSLVMSLSLLPPNALVGLITFGTMVCRNFRWYLKYIADFTGPSTRARLYRVCKVIRLPRQQRLYRQAGAGNAWTSAQCATAERTTTARSTTATYGLSSKVPASSSAM